MNKTLLKFVVYLLIFVPWLFSCKNGDVGDPVPVDDYPIPVQTNDGWETSSLSAVGIDAEIIINIIDDLHNAIDHQIHSILIVKDGKLVVEEYFSGYAFYHGPLTEFGRETLHNQASVTKSFTSALVGIAIDCGYIQDVNEKVFSFFPEYSNLNDDDKNEITLEHLLSMTSGFQWDESTYPYTDPRNDIVQLFYQNDPIRYILSKFVLHLPGEYFNYNGGCTNLLGEIIRKATGVRADDFAEQYLFAPLGITQYEWQELPNDVLYTSGDLKLRPRDMAKFGCLYLQYGFWKGERIITSIISKKWVEASTKETISLGTTSGYGYQWWLRTYEVNSNQIESFSALGWGGQRIIVFPSLNTVIVFTAGYYDEPELAGLIEIVTLNILTSVL